MSKISYGSKGVKFSVVTVVYNGEKEIKRTIESCLGQDYENIEYILIDGDSTDETKEIIENYKGKISVFLSEPDSGIYDAMNKAINLSTGDWIIFMNCGDIFYNNSVLTYIADALGKCEKKPDVIYGNTLYKYNKVFLKSLPLPLEKIDREMVFCHQSSLVRVDLIKKNMFDLKYRFAADYVMMQRLYFQKREFLYLDIYISVFSQIEGATLNNFTRSARERFSVHKNNKIVNLIKLEFYIMRIALGLILKRFIPRNLEEKIFADKYKNRIVQYIEK